MSRRKFEWSEEKTVFVAVCTALIVLCSLLAYVALTPPLEEGFISIYVLDHNKMAVNYSQLLVIGENNTFSVWVGVQNFMGRKEYCSVLVKMDDGTVLRNPSPIEPVKRFEKVLLNKETWEFPFAMKLNQTGNYRIVFELWLFDELKNVFSYSRSWCSIWFDVIES